MKKIIKFITEKKLEIYFSLGIIYVYSMFVHIFIIISYNSFNAENPHSLWRLLNPFLNFAALFSKGHLALLVIGFIITMSFNKELNCKVKNALGFGGQGYDKRGFNTDLHGTHGTSKFMSDNEIKREFGMSADFSGIREKIFAKHKGKFVGLRPQYGVNEHLMIIGGSGSGKTSGVTKPFIMKAMQNGESIIITDPKSELYETFAEIASTRYGYTVKAVNLIDVSHSDGFNILEGLRDENAEVDKIVQTIIRNTENGVKPSGDAFWRNAETSLLKTLIYYVCENNDAKNASLSSVYNILNDKNCNVYDLLNMFSIKNPNSETAKSFRNMKSFQEQNYGNVCIGLGNRLGIFQNKYINEALKQNDINFEAPGYTPCFYFLIIPDNSSHMQFLSSLFIGTTIQRLSASADSYIFNGSLPIKVNIFLEEFANIGIIPDFERSVATLRSRNIHCQIILQSIPQMKDRYQGNLWEDILSNFDTLLVMGANDLTTQDYISKLCGDMTVYSLKQSSSSNGPLLGVKNYSDGASTAVRRLLTTDEIRRLDGRKCLLITRRKDVAMLDKITYHDLGFLNDFPHKSIQSYQPQWITNMSNKTEDEPVNGKSISVSDLFL